MNKNIRRKMKETDLVIQSKKCMCCGKKDNISMHHVIPYRMNPVGNVIIPLCFGCHNIMHEEDIKGLIDYIYKHMMEMNSITLKLERYLKLKEK